MTGPQPTEDDLLVDLMKTNDKTEGKTITKKQYEKHGEYNPWQAENKFGSWRKAKASAGVFHPDPDRKRIKKKEILKDIKKVHEQVDGHIQIPDYKEKGKYSVSTIYERFPSFKSARAQAYKI